MSADLQHQCAITALHEQEKDPAARGNIVQLDFNRPSGWEELIASLSELSFDNILTVLKLVVDFLQGLDGGVGRLQPARRPAHPV